MFLSVIFDIAQIFGFIFVFLNNLSGIDPGSWIAFLTTFMTFIFFGDLSLWLIYAGSRGVVKLSVVFVFIPMLVLLTGFIFFFFG